MDLSIKLRQHYRVECVRDGKAIWVEEFDNLVTTVGKNKYLDATLKTGLSSPAWYAFLKGTGTVAAADTMASHSGWSEDTNYSNANRPAWTPGTVSSGSVDNSASPAAFTINGTTTIYGAGLVDNNTKGGTTGTLLGAADFGSSRAVISGDTLNVTVTCSLS
jgi:hypothetical protein